MWAWRMGRQYGKQSSEGTHNAILGGICDVALKDRADMGIGGAHINCPTGDVCRALQAPAPRQILA